MKTSIPDINAVGDVISKKYRQITTAVVDGTIAAMAIAKELNKIQDIMKKRAGMNRPLFLQQVLVMIALMALLMMYFMLVAAASTIFY
jgi:hypothetical protein